MIGNNLISTMDNLVLTFCQEYNKLFDNYYALANETVISSIKKAYEEITASRIKGEDIGVFSPMSDKEILNAFRQQIVLELSNIDPGLGNKISTQIDKFLKKNSTYAEKCFMHVPNDNHLAIKQYYDNHLIAKERIKKIELLVNMKKK